MRETFHLVPAALWVAADPDVPYQAASLADEGFVHCTDGALELLATANRYYRLDPRDFVVLTVDLEAAGSPWSVEDPGAIYPHIFGPIERAAILAVARLERAPNGAFTAISASPR